MLCQALPSAIASSVPNKISPGLEYSSHDLPMRSTERNPSYGGRLSDIQSTEPQHDPSESTESDRNTPSEQSYSKGQLGDDERSSEDYYESADSGPEYSGPPPPRSSSLFIGDRNARQPLPKSTTSSGETARAATQHTGAAGSRIGTHSPRSTNSSNKTPTQLSFDHAKAMPSMPSPLERTESPHEIHSVLPPDLGSHSSAERQIAESRGRQPSSTVRDMEPPPAIGGAQFGNRPPDIRTNNLILPIPQFSPLMGEPHFSTSLSSDLAQDPHHRGLSIGSIPSTLDPEHPPSPVSPFVQPREDSRDEKRGRTVIPVHHGIGHDFVDESSVERARRRSQSFSRPFQSGRTLEDTRPLIGPDTEHHPAFRQSSETREVRQQIDYHPGPASGQRRSVSRDQAPEYESLGQGAPDLPSAEKKSRSRRGSRSSTYLRAIRDSVSPSRRSQARERSQHSFPDSIKTSDSPHSTARSPDVNENDEKSRRSSIFGRIKASNNSASDQLPGKDSSALRAATMPMEHTNRVSTEMQKPTVYNSAPSSKMTAASRLGQKLQRASTTVTQVKPEPEIGKKKRFSGIGSLFGRNQKRQSEDQFTSVPPQQHQQYGKYTGRSRGPIQRFPLDEDPDEAPQQLQSHDDSPRNDAPPPQPEALEQSRGLPQSDLPAYVQDRILRQSTTPTNQQHVPKPANTRSSQASTLQRNSTSQEGVGSQRPSASRSKSSWTRFSQTARSNSDHQQSYTAAPPPQALVSLSHINDFVSSPPPTNESRPTQRSWIESKNALPKNDTKSSPQQQTTQEKLLRSESPPPPTPPKDERWIKPQSSSKPYHNHVRTGSAPLQSRSPASTQRQSLPPLQTSVSPRPPHTSARSSTPVLQQQQQLASSASPRDDTSNSSMTPEEKRKGRQEEIEKGHLSPSSAATATGSAQRGKMSVVHENETARSSPYGERSASRQVLQQEDEPIVMSATSFPGQLWQPDYLAWEGE